MSISAAQAHFQERYEQSPGEVEAVQFSLIEGSSIDFEKGGAFQRALNNGKSFSKLCTLAMINVHVGDRDICNIQKACPLLQNLSIHSVEWDTYSVSRGGFHPLQSLSLERVELRGFSFLNEVLYQLQDKNLKVLHLTHKGIPLEENQFSCVRRMPLESLEIQNFFSLDDSHLKDLEGKNLKRLSLRNCTRITGE